MTVAATLHLRERCPRLCQLAPEEIRYLLDCHRPHLELAPTLTPHVWKVTPGGVVGVLWTPRRRIILSPKMPVQNLLFLEEPYVPDSAATEPAPPPEVLDALVGRLASLMAERAQAGLHRDYRETAHQGPFLVGQLDLPAQLRQPPGRREQLHSRHDAFTLELPCNQVPWTLANRLASSLLLGPLVRSRLAQSANEFAPAGETPLTAPVLEELRSPRIPASYRPLLDLCLLLAEGMSTGQERGGAGPGSFLVSLERWFEQYLSRTVEEAFGNGGCRVQVQRTRLVTRTHPDRPEVTVRPDLTIDREDRPLVVLDAKWKRLAPTGPESADLYQALAYGGLLGVERTVLVYPGRGTPREYEFAQMSQRVWTWPLDVSGPLERCRRARRRLGRALARWCRQGE